MPSLKTFCIEFDRPNAIYTPGEIISGNVIVNLTSEKIVKALKLVVKGKAFVSWTEESAWMDTIEMMGACMDDDDDDMISINSITSTTYHSVNEEYFNLTIPLLEKSEGDGKVHLPIGLNRYSFRIQLPHNIPCSFEHENGYIRYKIKAIIDRSWKFNQTYTAPFTVIAVYDLNARPQQCVGIFDEVDEIFCSIFCFRNNSINVHIRLPMAGFIPGQWIEAILDLKDINGVGLEKVSAKLKQCLEFHVTKLGSTVKKQDQLNVAHVQTLGPFDKHTAITLRLKIPSVLPSELKFCSIIHLKYELHITLHVSGTYCNITKKYPILIGTIPLQSVPSVSAISPSLQKSESTSHTKIMPKLPKIYIAPDQQVFISERIS